MKAKVAVEEKAGSLLADAVSKWGEDDPRTVQLKKHYEASEKAASDYASELNRKVDQGLIKPPQLNAVLGGTPGIELMQEPRSKPGPQKRVLFPDVDKSKSIIFICDGSGSMTTKWPTLKSQLQQAIGELKREQSFNVIFFQGGKALSLSPDKLLAATDANMTQAIDFIETVKPNAPSDPMAALTLALRLKPQSVFFLTDGDFPDNAAVQKKIRALNATAKVQLNTIAFVNDKDTDKEFQKLLETIAKENGGTYRLVDESKLEN
jgi:gas vesicle protein